MAESVTQSKGCGCAFVGAMGVGVLGVVALVLPSLLSSAHKAKQSESITYIGALNRGQQAYYFDHFQLTTDLDVLGLGIQTETENYVYEAVAIGELAIQNNSMARKRGLYNNVGIVWVVEENSGEMITNSQLCKGLVRAHEPENAIFPYWLRSRFRSTEDIAYPPEAPPTFMLPALPATPETQVLCPAGYEAF
ncbi:MAG: type IV pilin-like G/H family protein [Cyanobacteria bacterium J06648_16]